MGFWNNKPLRNGVIIGAIALTVILVVILTY